MSRTFKHFLVADLPKLVPVDAPEELEVAHERLKRRKGFRGLVRRGDQTFMVIDERPQEPPRPMQRNGDPA